MKELYLIYINKIGTNFKGEHIFEFLFSDHTNYDWDENWYESSVVTDKNDLTPDPSFIKLVGGLKTPELRPLWTSTMWSGTPARLQHGVP